MRRLIERLVRAGMDVARINCAHDDTNDWRAMIANVREAKRVRKRPCKARRDLHQSEAMHVVRASLGALLEHIQVGQPVFIDDGKIRASVRTFSSFVPHRSQGLRNQRLYCAHGTHGDR